MAKIISQETFDSVVMENVTEFDMPINEAIEDAEKDFSAQGVLLANIVKNMTLSEDKKALQHEILVSLDKIRAVVDGKAELPKLDEPLKSFTSQCKCSLAHRVMATKHNSHATILKVIEKVDNDASLLEMSLVAMVALTEGNPDILTAEGCVVMQPLLETWASKKDNPQIPVYLALWSYESCLKHEKNRQNLVNNGGPGRIIELLKGHKDNAAIVKACCKALGAFVLDDDIRIEHGSAHDHARSLVEDHGMIKVILEVMKDWLEHVDVSSGLLLTLSKLCVRTEYCQQAVDNDALIVINDVLVNMPDHAGINKQAVALLRTISGNDKVKEQAMKSGAGSMVIACLNRHQNVGGVAEACIGALAMIALRVTANGKQLVEAGAHQAVVQAMKIHPKNIQVAKLGCMAIRNMVARIPENQKHFIECGVEDVIHTAISIHGEIVKDMAKAALRDCNLDVKLVEQWTGTGHEIERD
ncbi:unnamed protein product [Meganyctiphanes norvegica]|uniref:Armadillo repeat-containing protein 6 n=1 Tax=Meganyctiphanes norvegica TaxID=48144 RepID=A0AAV2SC26_MEGNR